MSIIYDALRKTQENRENIRDPQEMTGKTSVMKSNRNFEWPDIFLLGSIGALLILLIAIYLTHLSFTPDAKKVAVVTPPAVPAVTEPTPLPKLVLNGVFLSDHEQIAMINNQTYHFGDIVSGLKIVDIQGSSVKLQNEHHSIVLAVSN